MAIGMMRKVYEQQAKDMDEYLNRLKKMTKYEARQVSMKNLMEAGIITADGSLTERYSQSKKISRR
ncbi:MAG: hypothetical protein PHD70_01960 [Anaerostipes sp.]|nr:hypothetical protein [Anaerostipes sp.]